MVKTNTEMDLEAQAFDNRLRERIKNGHIPDLRKVQNCDWFYNNVWRRPYMVEMVYGKILQFALSHLKSKNKVLEVGCGPGYISLELARNGYDVTGLDVSEYSVQIANQMAQENPYLEGFGHLQYLKMDFLLSDFFENSYDAICFFQTLHHFDSPELVINKAKKILKPNGIIIVNEPSRDLITRKDASLYALIRILLSAGDHWYLKIPTPQSEEELKKYIQKCFNEFKEAKDYNEDAQSIHDNASYSSEIITLLNENFTNKTVEWDYAFLPRTVGGLRFDSEEKTESVANFLQIFDLFAINTGLIQPGGFFYAGLVKK
jgi:2-polyprenyl-3-methyl-5-hydroxy-6-metoxy-1,4-benzoquinol methylase